MIDIKFEVLDGMPCTTKTFEINGVEAFVTDFGDYIRIPSDSGYGCESMTVKIDSHNKLTAMKKYKISMRNISPYVYLVPSLLIFGIFPLI